jgi:AbrB family looped-hinge helix DNA binding protein
VPELNWRPIIPSTGNQTQPNGNADSRFISIGPRVASTLTLVREIIPAPIPKPSDLQFYVYTFYAIILPVRKEAVMETLATTRMSSKGQVVIPESIRKRLDLKEGAQFIVVGDEDVVILKIVTPPDMNEFNTLIKQARKQAKEAGLKQKDITSAVARARDRK